MKRFKDNIVSSKNSRYKRQPNTISTFAGVLCEKCGNRMNMDIYGIYKCPICDKDSIDNCVF